MLTIEDELAQNELLDSIRSGDGSKVAHVASDLVVSGRSNLVRRACMECAPLCRPEHARAVIDFFTSKTGARRGEEGRRDLAGMVATVMAGVRAGCDAAVPRGPCRSAVDAVIAMQGDSNHLDNLEKLPAKLGPMWLGVVALAREAVLTAAPQEPLVLNDRLCSLFEGRDPRNDRGGISDVSADDIDIKLGVLWSYSRETRTDADRECEQFASTNRTATAAHCFENRVVACDAMPPTEPEVTCILDAG